MGSPETELDEKTIAPQRIGPSGGYFTRPLRIVVHPDDIPAIRQTEQGRMILASAGYAEYNSASDELDAQAGLMPAEPSAEGSIGLAARGGYIYQEYNTRIAKFSDRMTVFEEMRRSEPAVAVIELLTSLPLGHTRFYIEPGDDTEFADFLQWNLSDGLTRPFAETMREAALAMLYGVSWCYPTYEPKAFNGRIWQGWEQFEPRVRSTIYQWRFNERGRCVGLISYGLHPITGEPKYVSYDAAEIIRWTWREDGGDPEGCGALRQAFKPYSYLEALEEFAAIKVEREACGVLVATYNEQDAGGAPYNKDDERDILTQMANIRVGRVQGITLPAGWSLVSLNVGSQGGIPFLQFIENRRRDILSTVGAQFVGGDISSGIGQKDASNVFLMLIDHAADWLCDTFNQQALPIIANMNGVEEQKKTKLLHGPVGVKDIEKFAMALEKVTRHPESITDAERAVMNDEMGLPPPVEGTQEQAIALATERAQPH